ncbi:MAG TPA: HK97 family phage prohead protease, partial [Burkholderiaceae bacterium]|nr:HK97 family phage prohead protease [Burkholderiaceae bacterium]
EPKGAQFQLPVPLLWQHNHDQPIGHVTEANVNNKRIEITAEFAKMDEPGVLQDRLNEAWQSVKAGLVRGLSIGFRALDVEPIKESMGLRFKSWEWLELSAVTIPANSEANIQTIKSIWSPYRDQIVINGGYRLQAIEPKRYNNADGSFNLRMPGDR